MENFIVDNLAPVNMADVTRAIVCYVPEYFVFPTTDVKTMWNLWHYGNLSERIRPYKLLNTDGHRADLKEKKQKVNLYRANVVMSKLLQIAVNLNLLGENDSIESLPRERADEIYYKSYDMMIMELYDEHPLRMNEINYNTIANRLCKQINS
jgi:hypothetical protein